MTDSSANVRPRILFMDDEPDIRKIGQRVLAHLGYDATLAADGAAAIEIYQEAMASGKPFAAVILDLTIPGGMGGTEALVKLLKIDPNIKAIVSSGYSNDKGSNNYESFGFVANVSKPYEIATLKRVLAGVIDGTA